MGMKKLFSSSFSLFSISLVAALALMFHNNQPTVSLYSPMHLVAVYPLSLEELSNEEKIEAFEYVALTGDCSYKGIKLQGKVKFVTSFPDIKIQYVTSFPDIKVKYVTSFPNACGLWQVVESFPDFKIQVVESFPDIKVQLVESFPGMK
jgi:hypothetical protein